MDVGARFASFILISLLFLLKDMDNPFEGHAKVEFGAMVRLESYLKKDELVR